MAGGAVGISIVGAETGLAAGTPRGVEEGAKGGGRVDRAGGTAATAAGERDAAGVVAGASAATEDRGGDGCGDGGGMNSLADAAGAVVEGAGAEGAAAGAVVAGTAGGGTFVVASRGASGVGGLAAGLGSLLAFRVPRGTRCEAGL